MNRKLITFSQILSLSFFASSVPGLGMILLPLTWALCGGKYAWGYFGAQLALGLPQVIQIVVSSYTFSSLSVPATIHYAASHVGGVAASSTAKQFVTWLFALPYWERTLLVTLIEVGPYIAFALFIAAFYEILKAVSKRIRTKLQPFVKFQL